MLSNKRGKIQAAAATARKERRGAWWKGEAGWKLALVLAEGRKWPKEKRLKVGKRIGDCQVAQNRSGEEVKTKIGKGWWGKKCTP